MEFLLTLIGFCLAGFAVVAYASGSLVLVRCKDGFDVVMGSIVLVVASLLATFSTMAFLNAFAP